MLDIYNEYSADKFWVVQVYYWQSDIKDLLFFYNRNNWIAQ